MMEETSAATATPDKPASADRTVLNSGIPARERGECLLCGRPGPIVHAEIRDFIFGAPGAWSIRRCGGCGFHWIDPQPLPESLARIYDNYSTHTPARPRLAFASRRKKIQDSILAVYFGYRGLSRTLDPLSRIGGRLLGLMPPVRRRAAASILFVDGTRTGRLLDVGCGNGAFLDRMREIGWEVQGVEPDPKAACAAGECLGVPVIAGGLEDAGLPPDSYDAVAMRHVIEHAPNPVALLAECRRVLKPGGRIYILTPNVDSLGHGIFRQSWRGLEIPRHFGLHSLETLTDSARRAGIEPEKAWTSARGCRRIWEESRYIRDRIRGAGSAGRRKRTAEGILFQCLESFVLLFSKKSGEDLFFIGRKNPPDPGGREP